MFPQDLFAAITPAGLPPFVVPLAVGLLLIALALWLVVRARAPRKARPAGERNGIGRRLGRASAGGLRRLLGETLAVGRYLTTRREWRYRQPWVVMLGERGAGKSSITESISLGRRETLLAKEQNLSAPDTEWVFFNRGVLIDVDGATSDGDPSGDDPRRWDEVLERLDHYRPERPVDAAVLTLSAPTLLRASGAELHALAERCYRQLWEMQKRLDLTFPVYVVVGHADAIPGFHAFWSAQPKELRQQIFGWSTPHALTNSFSTEWLDTAFATLDEELGGLQLNAAASGTELRDPDEYFLFPQRFAALEAPLKVVLGQIFRSGALHEDFYFRGLYFTGTTEGDQPTGNHRAERTDIAFVDELFDERIFRETNLARPTRQGVLSRNQFIRRFQLTVMGLAAALVVALGLSTWSLNEQLTAARNAHDLIKNNTPERQAGGACLRRAPLFELLENVANIGLDVRYTAIPASWFDRRVNDINRREIADTAFEGVIFPALACRLEERARELVDAAGRTIPKGDPGAATTERAVAAVGDYADQAAELALNLTRFKRITRRSQDTGDAFDRFVALVTYLYQAPVPAVVKANQGLLRAALAHVEHQTPLALPEGMEAQVSSVLDSRAGVAAEQLMLRLSSGAALLRELENTPSLDEIIQLHDWLLWVRNQWLDARPGHNPCGALNEAIAADLATLDQHGYPDLPAVSARLSDPTCFAPGKRLLASLRIAPYGPLFPEKGGKLEVPEWMDRELDGFKTLLAQDFMKVKPALPFQCRQPLLGWRDDKLAEASRYLRQYETFTQRQGIAADGTDSRLYDRLGRIHLGAVIDDLFTQAQRRERVADAATGLASLSSSEEEVEGKSDAFQRTLDPLILTLDKYRRLGFASSQSRVLQCARDYAANTLGRIENLAEGSRLYEVPSNLGPLAPETPFFDLGATAQTKAWLGRQLARAQVLAGYSVPFVTFLKNSAAINDANQPDVDTGDYWEATIDEINRLVQFKDPTSQAANLEGFIGDQLSGLDQTNCHGVLGDYKRPAYGNDLFSRRRDQLTFLADWYCRDHAVASLLDHYLSLARRFNAELAGRFPFGPPESADANPAVVRAFFRDYAGERASLEASVKSLQGDQWREVRDFVDGLNAAADLFDATLNAADGAQPVALKVTFRHLPEQSPGSEQVVAWHLDTGLESATYPNGADQLSWNFGDPLAADLTWAELSPVRPLPDGDQPDLGVSGRLASFAADGPWALLRLFRRHHVEHLDQAGLSVLRFTVPVRVDGAPRQATPVRARMYLALAPSAADPKTKAEKPLALPAGFPTAAPLPR